MRRSRAEESDSDSDSDFDYTGVGMISSGVGNREKMSYCTKCQQVGILSVLKHRIYFNDKGEINPNPPADHNEWLQCWKCGDIIAVNLAKLESDIETLTKPTDNPFRFNKKSVLGVGEDNPRRFDRTSGNSKSHYLHKKNFKEMLSEFKDNDVKAALKKGAKLISYTETNATEYK